MPAISPPSAPACGNSFARGLYYVQTNFDDLEGYKQLASQLEQVDQERGTLGNRLYYLSTPPDAYPIIVQNLGAAGLANTAPRGLAQRQRQHCLPASARRPTPPGGASSSKSPSATTSPAPSSSTGRSARCFRKSKSTASTTTWAKRPCRTSWCSASPTASGSRSGAAATSTACRSWWPRAWAWRTAPRITTTRARCATCCRTT